MAAVRDFDKRLAAIARELVHEPDMQHTLQRIVELAAANLDGEVYASVSLVRQRRQVDTPASSDERATRADQLQYETSQGPCLDAIWKLRIARGEILGRHPGSAHFPSSYPFRNRDCASGKPFPSYVEQRRLCRKEARVPVLSMSAKWRSVAHVAAGSLRL